MRFDDLAPPGESVALHVGSSTLIGDLAVPADPRGVIVFARGGQGAHDNPRDRAVAAQLQDRGFATLILELLTHEERLVDEVTRRLRYDVGLLGARLVAVVDWLGRHPPTEDLPIGLLASSIGAGAALVAASERPSMVGAVVSRGGRPDLAGAALARVRAPTLIIVGGQDTVLEDHNVHALHQLRTEVGFAVVPRATHLFEEEDALAEATALATEWFDRHLVRWTTQSGERLVVPRPAQRAGL
jgi:putative phosphoribosyl transferase